MSDPALLMLDEPSLGLAPSTAELVFEAIGKLRQESDISMVVVEQNVELAFTLVDEAAVLEAGHCVLSGPKEELMGMDAIRQAYLGG